MRNANWINKLVILLKAMHIEQEFLYSWDQIELRYEGLQKISEIITAIRTLGFDKSLRAGLSVFDLMLSRSKKHGLRPDQAYVHLGFYPIISSLQGLQHIEILKQKEGLSEEELASLVDAERKLNSTKSKLIIHFHGDTVDKTCTTPVMITEELTEMLYALEKIPLS